MPEEQFPLLGALPDDRTEEERLKDYKQEEIVAAAVPVSWAEKPEDKWRRFPISNQDGSGSCVAQTAAKEFAIMLFLKTGNFLQFSATHIYQRRKNKPDGGMNAADCRNILRNGVTLEALLPSQNMNDKQMDEAKIQPYMVEVAAVFKAPNYVELKSGDIDAIASTIQATGKGVMVWFYFTYAEWTTIPKVLNPKLSRSAAGTLRHSVTAVDFFMRNGKKCLLIDDSWGLDAANKGQRIIDEDFFKARNWYASYLVNFKYEDQTPVTPTPLPLPTPTPTPVPAKPKYTFTSALTYGQNSPAVRALQDILRFEGLFPSNVASTGLYGAITAKGVFAWQKKYQVAPIAELEALQGRRVGDKTIKTLNQFYA